MLKSLVQDFVGNSLLSLQTLKKLFWNLLRIELSTN
jgi:hypothetical protein